MGIVCAIVLSTLYLVAGYAVCAGARPIAEALANAAIEAQDSAFSQEQLVEGALAVRDYSFGEHDRETLVATIDRINEEAGTGYLQSEWPTDAASGHCVLDEAAIEHLDDVWGVAQKAAYPIIGLVILAAFCILGTLSLFGSRALIPSFVWSGAIDLVLIGVLLGWALVSFDSLFALFHTLFFEGGTWTFAADSLLITMLPTRFWMGMGAVWVATSTLLSAISLAAGLLLRRRMLRSLRGFQRLEGNE